MKISLVKSFIDVILQTELLTYKSLTNSQCQSQCTGRNTAMLDLSQLEKVNFTEYLEGSTNSDKAFNDFDSMRLRVSTRCFLTVKFIVNFQVHVDSEFDAINLKWFSKRTKEQVTSSSWLRYPVRVRN